MSALQNTVCQEVRNSFRHKTEQPQKGYKKSRHNRSIHNFNNWNQVPTSKFILTEQLNKIKNTSTEVLKQRLKDRENYRIKMLKTLRPFGLRTKLIPWHAVLLPFTTVPSLCIWVKYMTSMSLKDAQ